LHRRVRNCGHDDATASSSISRDTISIQLRIVSREGQAVEDGVELRCRRVSLRPEGAAELRIQALAPPRSLAPRKTLNRETAGKLWRKSLSASGLTTLGSTVRIWPRSNWTIAASSSDQICAAKSVTDLTQD
jgi:hypothetical protein